MNTVWGTGYFPLPPGSYTVLPPDVPHDANMTSIHEALLSHRTVDGRGIALLTVKGKPERER
ncbi:hypothetical protein OU995_13100 [Roseateles sp. SL47]|uniref:hypothetical protein n=1 Tax=Roseateles sp. SL47 TaxID=2995138 RepID=UPI00226EDFC2|nr:hypothetical protein [Roseateles sp. SL47]WAC75575.1 hypothetical protein OU995_13100 [Roseateles sp. SL47]